MLRRSIMAAVARKKGLLRGMESPSSATSRGPPISSIPPKTQIRLFNSQSSPVYKTQGAQGLTDGFRNLSIRDTRKTANVAVKRKYFVGSSNATVKSLADVAQLIKENAFTRVVVLAGAGISTPSGIPDFRSPGTGLYDNLQRYNIPYPEAIFDIDYFHHNPRPFFELAKELYPSGKYRPNYTHYFIRMLHEKGILLRMYTQNIDGLERLAGIPPEKLVEAHGTFATATCTSCDHRYKGDEIKSKIFEGKLPKCKQRGCSGLVKPDIVFFGEDLPAKFYSYLKDMLQTDLAIVMGTSLEVQPFADIIDNVRWGVPRVLFNKKAVGPFRIRRRSKDIVAAGDLLETTQKFVGMLGWKEEMAELIATHEKDFKFVEPVTVPVPPGEAEKKEEKRDAPYNFLSRQNACLRLMPDAESESSSSSSVTSESSEDLSSAEETHRGRAHRYRPAPKVNNQRNSRLPGKGSSSTVNGAAKNAPQPRNNKPSLPSQRKAPTPTDDVSSVSDIASVSGRSIGKSSLRSLGNVSNGSKASTKGPSPGTTKNDPSRKFSTSVASDVGPRGARNGGVPARKPAPAVAEKKAQNLHNLGRLGRVPPASDRRPGPNSKTTTGPPTAIQVYRQIRRVGSADIPKLNYRHKLQRPYGEHGLSVNPPPMYGISSSSSSDSDSDSR